MKDFRVKFGYVLSRREDVEDHLTLGELFTAIKVGEWKSLVEKARAFKGKQRYDSFKKKSIPAVWIHELPLMCFDWEGEKITIPHEYIFAHFKSVGGTNHAVIVKLPEELRPDEWKDYRRQLQAQYGIKSNERQISNDRPRFVSFDPEIFVNWKSKPLAVGNPGSASGPGEYRQKESSASAIYEAAKAGNIGLDNDTALSIFSWLRNKAFTYHETIQELESLNFKSHSLRTESARKKYYEKWEEQYGDEFPGGRVTIRTLGKLVDVKKQQEPFKPQLPEPGEPADVYVTDQEQIDLSIATAISPYVPIDIEYFGKTMPVTLASVFVGTPSSGKGYINNIVEILDDIIEPIEDDLYNWRVDYYTGAVSINGKEIHTPLDEKKVHKFMPNLSLKWGFQGTDAALLGMLSEVPAVLIYTSDFATAMSALGKDYNSGLVSTLLQLTEGEIIDKINKRQDVFGKTKFKLKNYKASMLIGGTPDDIVRIFSKNVSNGLVSRILFVNLKDSNRDKVLLTRKPPVEKHISSDIMLKTITGELPRIQAKYDMDFVDNLKADLLDEYDGIMKHSVRRGVRDAIKRAAIKAWMEGERKSFKLAKKDIEMQMEFFYKSQRFVDSFQDHETDKWGNNLLQTKINEAKEVVSGKAMLIKQGVKISTKDIKMIVETFESSGRNLARTARIFGVSRQTMYRILKSRNA